ncbi:MAG: hypothetical protein IT355_20945 [Gemmatimonadaceae bacterium]|nr:hypothetical protein [Gemmatimonadaceae bacterium]
MKHRILRILAGAVVLAMAGALVMLIRFRLRTEREDPATVRREIAQLTRQRDSLRAVVFDVVGTSDLLDGRPEGDIVIGLPTPFVDTIVRSVITGWFHDVDLRLPRMRLHKDGDVRARLGILGRRRVGTYSLDMTLDGVRGRLQPGSPEMTFGGDVIRLVLPVRVANGTGVTRITAGWESKGLAGPVCGDMTVTRDVTGQVRARTYVARGRLTLSAVEGAVYADPDFPDLSMRLFVDPSPRSVAALDSILGSRGGLCGYAVDKSRASERIQALVARGFRVRIPQKFFRPVHLPVAVQTTVPVAGRAVALEVAASGLAVTPSAVWIAARVRAAPGAVPTPAAPAPAVQAIRRP